MANLVEAGVTDRLIDNVYLHSNTDNFVSVAQTLRWHQLSNKKDLSIYKDLLERLKNIIVKYNNKMIALYTDLGLINKSEGDISFGSNDDIILHMAGAKEFRQKFLMNKFLEKQKGGSQLSKQQAIYTIINSMESLSKLSEIYEKELSELLDKKLNDLPEFTKLQREILELIQEIVGEETSNFTIKELQDLIENGLVETHGTRQKIKNSKTQMENIKKLIKKLKLRVDDISITKKSDISEIITAIKTQLINQFLYENMAKRYWDEFLKIKYYELKPKNLLSDKEKLKSDDRKKFIRNFVSTLKKYDSINFKKEDNTKNNTSTNDLRGFLGEFGFFIGMKLEYDIAIKITGQDYETRVNVQEDEKGNLSNQYNTVQRADDIIITGKSGREYKFQVKNSLGQLSNILAFRAQSPIKISTFLNSSLEGNSYMQDLLAYILVNEAYLSKAGLSKYNGKNKTTVNLLKVSVQEQLKYYTIFLLSQSYQFILGSEYKVQIDKAIKAVEGNIAYIYQGRYLIPITAFFVQAYQILQLLHKQSKNIKGDLGDMSNSFGGLSLPSYTNIKDIQVDSGNSLVQKNRQIQRAKIRTLKYISNNSEKVYKYPQQLVDVGSKYGRIMYNNLKFKLRVTLFLKKLEDLVPFI